MDLVKGLDEGQDRMHAALVRSDEDPALTDVPEVGDGAGGFVGQAQQARGVVAEHIPGVGQGTVTRGPVDQALAEGVFESSNSLAGRWLRPAELPRGARKAAFGSHGHEHAQIIEREDV